MCKQVEEKAKCMHTNTLKYLHIHTLTNCIHSQNSLLWLSGCDCWKRCTNVHQKTCKTFKPKKINKNYEKYNCQV